MLTESALFPAVSVIALLTAALRFLPFLIFRDEKKTPRVILHLGQALPCAVMGMLVVYCLKDVSFASPAGFVPPLAAGTLTAVSYAVKRSTLLSILLGTVCYMVLIRVM